MITIDRIDEQLAVLLYDDGSRREVPISQLPDGAREGIVLTETEDGFALDESSTAARRRRMAKRARSLFKKR